MGLTPPSTLSPSKVSSFKNCALAFRFSAIDHLPEPPTVQTLKGTLVHRALELLFAELPPGMRDRQAASSVLATARSEMENGDDLALLGLTPEEESAFFEDAARLVENYFGLEDPNRVDAIATELTLEAEVGGVILRGIIDRLDRSPTGGLVVTDYKTGRAPAGGHEASKMLGVNFYAMLLKEAMGQAPEQVQLLYLGDQVAILAEVSDRSIDMSRRQALAVWQAITRACEDEDFRPRPSALCSWCAFRGICPAWGAVETPVASAPAPTGASEVEISSGH
jgi:putative RecB family exonuclease